MQAKLSSLQHECGTQWVASGVLGLQIGLVNVFIAEIGMPHSGHYVSGFGERASLAEGTGRGALAGLAATVPMTGAMLAVGALARRGKQPPFPPRRVAAGLTKRVGLWQRMSERQHKTLTLVSHFGYGAMAGALYGAYAARRPTTATNGIAYGLLIWAASYAGWLPALHILPPPWRPPHRRTLQLIAAHLVWGLSLGWLLRRR